MVLRMAKLLAAVHIGPVMPKTTPYPDARKTSHGLGSLSYGPSEAVPLVMATSAGTAALP